VFPGARTIIPIGVSPVPPPELPGSFVFSKKYDDFYADEVVSPGLVDYRTVPGILNEIWSAQKRIQKYLNAIP
jgi:hypothetical protein